MLITFKCDADGDVIMFGEVGQQMLEIFGKDPADARGIITVAQLAAAESCLAQAVEQDRQAWIEEERAAEAEAEAEAARRESADESEWPADVAERERARRAQEPRIRLAQRAAPLLTMLGHARRANKPVIWEAT